MIDLKYDWHPHEGTPLETLYKEATDLGSISEMARWSDGWRAIIELGDWNDLYARCVGTGPSREAALGVAVAKAKWVADRLTDPNDVP